MKTNTHKLHALSVLSGTEMGGWGLPLKCLYWLEQSTLRCVLPWPSCCHQWSIAIAQSAAVVHCWSSLEMGSTCGSPFAAAVTHGLPFILITPDFLFSQKLWLWAVCFARMCSVVTNVLIMGTHFYAPMACEPFTVVLFFHYSLFMLNNLSHKSPDIALAPWQSDWDVCR